MISSFSPAWWPWYSPLRPSTGPVRSALWTLTLPIELYCMHVSRRYNRVKSTICRLQFYFHVLANLGQLNVILLFLIIIMALILPSGARAVTSKPLAFVWACKITLNLSFSVLKRLVPDRIMEVRRMLVQWKSLARFVLSGNLVSGRRQWSIFGGEGLLLYFGFLVARLLSPRSPLTQFELTLPVQGEPWPGAMECDNSRNTMKSNITLSYTVTHTHNQDTLLI